MARLKRWDMERRDGDHLLGAIFMFVVFMLTVRIFV